MQPQVVDTLLLLCMLSIRLLRHTIKLRKCNPIPHSPLSAASTGSKIGFEPFGSQLLNVDSLFCKVYDTSERVVLCFVHPSQPRSVLAMSDTVNKQPKKRGKRKHGGSRASMVEDTPSPVSDTTLMQHLQEPNQLQIQKQSLQRVR